MSKTSIPEGFELLVGRSRENAKLAIATAEERGFPSSAVLTQSDGYLIPLGDSEDSGEEQEEQEEIVAPKETDKVADVEAFAKEHEIDISSASNNAERVALIQAALESKKEN